MILIVGPSNNYNHLNQVKQIHSIEQFKSSYDYASVLARACERAFELGQTTCYVCNVQADSDYFEIADQIKSLEIDFILTPDLRFDKKLVLKDGRKLPLYLILSELLPDNMFIVTDYHAREFVDMSHFLRHYNTVRYKLEQLARYPDNISFVANDLVDSDSADIDVACALLNAPISEYPTLPLGDSYYNLESEDFLSPIAYFKNGLVDNLFNLSTGLESNLVIQRMLNILRAEIDELLNYLAGTRFTKNTLFTVRYKTEDYLKFRKGRYYEKYRIADVVINNGSIYTDIEIYPFFSSNNIRTQVMIQGV